MIQKNDFPLLLKFGNYLIFARRRTPLTVRKNGLKHYKHYQAKR